MKKKFIQIVNRIFSDLRMIRIPLLILLIYALFANYFFNSFCPFKVFYGIPCPACGMSRATLMIVTGHLKEAFEFQPVTYIADFMIVVYFFNRYVRNADNRSSTLGIIVSCIIAILYYVYKMSTYFPNGHLYSYCDRNILHILMNCIVKILS